MQLTTKHDASLYYEVIDLTPPWIEAPPTIVFSHGIGINCEIWNSWLHVLTPYFRIVRFDTRGFGRSTQGSSGVPWSLDLWADDILAVASATETKQFHLVGESLAGAVSLHLAARGDAPLLSVTTVSSPYRGRDLTKVGGWRARLKDEGIKAWSDTMMDQRFYRNGLPQAAWDWFSAEQATSDPDTLLALADMLLAADLSDELSRVRSPVLILAADASPYVTPDIATSMQRLIANAELAIFTNSRHGLPFSHGPQCARTLLDFLRRRNLVPAEVR
jgi:pimeloyl-ACP methyl ester carboxylesterase